MFTMQVNIAREGDLSCFASSFGENICPKENILFQIRWRVKFRDHLALGASNSTWKTSMQLS